MVRIYLEEEYIEEILEYELLEMERGNKERRIFIEYQSNND